MKFTFFMVFALGLFAVQGHAEFTALTNRVIKDGTVAP